MTVQHSANLKLNKPDTDHKPWDVELQALADLVDEAVSGFLSKAITGNVSMTIDNGLTSEIRHRVIRFTGTLTGDATITVPTIQKSWIMQNLTTGGFKLIIKTAAGASADLLFGDTAEVFCDGTDCFNLSTITNTIENSRLLHQTRSFSPGGPAFYKGEDVLQTGVGDLVSFSIPIQFLAIGEGLQISFFTSSDSGTSGNIEFQFGTTPATVVNYAQNINQEAYVTINLARWDTTRVSAWSIVTVQTTIGDGVPNLVFSDVAGIDFTVAQTMRVRVVANVGSMNVRLRGGFIAQLMRP